MATKTSRAKVGGSKKTKKTAKKAKKKKTTTAKKPSVKKEPVAKKKTAGKKKTAAKRPPTTRARPKKLTPEARWKMIAEAAYYLAEKHGFSGDPVADWINAERAIEEWLASK